MASKYTAPNDYRAFCEMLGETENTMTHHGVKGQKWGIRNYQNADGSLTAAGRKHYGYGEARNKNKEEDNKKETDKKTDQLEKIESNFKFDKKYTVNDALVQRCIKVTTEFEAERTHNIHQDEYENRARAKDELKSVLALTYGASVGLGTAYGAAIGATTGAGAGIGAAIGAAGGAAAGTYLSLPTLGLYGVSAAKARHANAKAEKEIRDIQNNKNVDPKTGLKLKNKISTADEDMAKVNPAYNNWSDNTKNNCLLCTNAYALRRKGYDVMANGANDGYSGAIFLNFYPKATLERVRIPNYVTGRNINDVVKNFKIPEGGYGAISVQWQGDGGGHSMVYCVEKGKPVLRDCQSNKVYRGAKVNQIFNNAVKDVRIVRLDNVEPDVKAMLGVNAIHPGGQNFEAKKTAAEKAAEKVVATDNGVKQTTNFANGNKGKTKLETDIKRLNTNNTFIGKAAKSLDGNLDDLYSQKDVDAFKKNLKVINISNGKIQYVSKDASGNTERFESKFITSPNGQIIPIDLYLK